MNKGFIYKNASVSTAFTYDTNGNLTSDANKGITSIEYNYLNLPMKIVFNRTFMTSYSNGSIEFIYDATGVKLRKTVKDVNGNVLDTRDYVNGVEYNNGTLSRIAHTEGSVTRNEFGAYEHQYVLRDHLGNTRVTFRDGVNKGEAYFDWTTYQYIDPNAGNTTGLNDGVITSADIMQINSYYPFGLNMEGNWNGAAGNNKIQYNGKEWNDDFGLGWNDYGARFYDPAIFRWLSPDPLSHKFSNESPYNYAGNNPIKNIDVGGRFKFPAHLYEQYKKDYPNFFKYIESGFGNTIQNSALTKSVLLQYSVGMLTDKQMAEDSKFRTGGPTIEIIKGGGIVFDGNTLYDKDDKGNRNITIQINEEKIRTFENLMNNPKASDVQKRVALLSIHSTLINEYTQYGDALDDFDAILDKNGNIVNGTQSDFGGGLYEPKEYDEGNGAAQVLFGGIAQESDYSRVYYLRVHGQKTVYSPNGPKLMPVGPNDPMQKDATVVPFLPK